MDFVAGKPWEKREKDPRSKEWEERSGSRQILVSVFGNSTRRSARGASVVKTFTILFVDPFSLSLRSTIFLMEN